MLLTKKTTTAFKQNRIDICKWCMVWTKWDAMICFSCLSRGLKQHNQTLSTCGVFQRCLLPTRDCQRSGLLSVNMKENWEKKKKNVNGEKHCKSFSCATILVSVCKQEYAMQLSCWETMKEKWNSLLNNTFV